MIRIDTREQENKHIAQAFDALGVEYDTTKPLIVGDYMSINAPNVFIERKNSWLEFAGNCGKGHNTFKRELERLDQTGGKMYLLVEETTPLEKWRNRCGQMKGVVMQKILSAWLTKHNIELVQCHPSDTPRKILEILKEVQK